MGLLGVYAAQLLHQPFRRTCITLLRKALKYLRKFFNRLKTHAL